MGTLKRNKHTNLYLLATFDPKGILLIMSTCVYWPKQTTLWTHIIYTVRSDVGGDPSLVCFNMPDEEQNKGGEMNEVLVFWVLNLMMHLDQY